MSVSLNVKLRQRNIPVDGVSLSWTVLRFKQHLEVKIEEDCPVERQRLINKGRILSSEDRTLSDYGVVANDSIYLVIGRSSNNDNNTNASPVPDTSNSNNINNNASPVVGAGGNGDNLANMMNMFGGMNSGNSNNNGNMMNQIQQQLMQNPEMMQNMMNSPIFESMMNNPDLLRNMMESNPQFRTLAEQNPELRHVLDNPEMMRQSMELMRNPEAMQQFMRHQDLALSQIENVPGGFAALSRMYRDVQEPMMDAMIPDSTPSNSSTNTSTANTNQNTNQGAAGTAMPNPWGSPTANSNNSANPATSNNVSNPSAANANNMFNPWAAPGAGAGEAANPFAAGFNPMAGGGAGQAQQLEQTINMLETNPMMRQMMDQMLTQNPEMIAQMMQSNPMMQEMTRQNPAVASMMNNPQFIRNMMQPETMRSMLNLQRNLGGMPEMPGMGAGVNAPGNNTNENLDFSNLLNQFQNTSLFQPPTNAGTTGQVPPEQRFRMQLQSLNDMGFDDNASNIRVLEQTHGNVNLAIDVLLSSPLSVPAAPSPAPATTTQAEEETDQGVEKNQTDKKND